MKKISDALRGAIKGSGQTRYRIAQETGVNESTLSRFMGGAALSTDNADKLAAYLGLELVNQNQRHNREGR